MHLRPATTDDVETLFAIRCSVRENYQSREELAGLGITPGTVKAMLMSGEYVATLAIVDGQPVGFTMAHIPEGYILACFVRPEFEGRGVGRAVMRAAEEGLRAAGVTSAWLSTGQEPGLRAPGFYRHLGWQEDGHLEDGQLRFTKQL